MKVLIKGSGMEVCVKKLTEEEVQKFQNNDEEMDIQKIMGKEWPELHDVFYYSGPNSDELELEDEDGNEISGIKMPDISVPIATHTGWNLRSPETGSPEQLISMIGISSTFPISKAQRESTNDPRLSIKERYASKELYLRKVRKEADKLADDGYIIPKDTEVIVENCLDRYEKAMSGLRSSPSDAVDE